MVTIELCKKTKEYVQYKFYPEGKTEKFGIVQVNLSDFKRVLVKDIENEWSAYKGHAWREVERFARKGEFPQHSMVAWY